MPTCTVKIGPLICKGLKPFEQFEDELYDLTEIVRYFFQGPQGSTMFQGSVMFSAFSNSGSILSGHYINFSEYLVNKGDALDLTSGTPDFIIFPKKLEGYKYQLDGIFFSLALNFCTEPQSLE